MENNDNPIIDVFFIVENISDLSNEDLDYLVKEFEKEKKRRLAQKQKETAETIKRLAKEAGLGVEITIESDNPNIPNIANTPSRETKKAKYINPSNPRETWGGKGAQPKWLKNKLASGHSLDEFESS
jgi:DNA-binding protein H-NS